MNASKQPITSDELMRVVEQLLNIEEGSLKATTRFLDVPAWDSMGVLLLMAELDERFNITLSELTLANLKGVEDIINVVRTAGLLTA